MPDLIIKRGGNAAGGLLVPRLPRPRWPGAPDHPCFGCGNSGMDLYDVGCYNNWWAVCAQCYLGGDEKTLREEGHRLMGKMVGPKKLEMNVCYACRKPKSPTIERYWCDDCERDRRQITGR